MMDMKSEVWLGTGQATFCAWSAGGLSEEVTFEKDPVKGGSRGQQLQGP